MLKQIYSPSEKMLMLLLSFCPWIKELRIDPELDDRLNPRPTLSKLAFHFILPYLAVLAGGSWLILWHRGTEETPPPVGDTHPVHGHMGLELKPSLEGGLRVPLYKKIDHKTRHSTKCFAICRNIWFLTATNQIPTKVT